LIKCRMWVNEHLSRRGRRYFVGRISAVPPVGVNNADLEALAGVPLDFNVHRAASGQHPLCSAHLRTRVGGFCIPTASRCMARTDI
jgi:hypothetical protein